MIENWARSLVNAEWEALLFIIKQSGGNDATKTNGNPEPACPLFNVQASKNCGIDNDGTYGIRMATQAPDVT